MPKKNIYLPDKLNKKQKQLYLALLAAYDVAEGQYSNIPGCCIDAYVGGRTWMSVVEELTPEERKKLSGKYNYVPCTKCLEKGKSVEVKSGQSLIGKVLITLMQEVKENKNV